MNTSDGLVREDISKKETEILTYNPMRKKATKGLERWIFWTSAAQRHWEGPKDVLGTEVSPRLPTSATYVRSRITNMIPYFLCSVFIRYSSRHPGEYSSKIHVLTL